MAKCVGNERGTHRARARERKKERNEMNSVYYKLWFISAFQNPIVMFECGIRRILFCTSCSIPSELTNSRNNWMELDDHNVNTFTFTFAKFECSTSDVVVHEQFATL